MILTKTPSRRIFQRYRLPDESGRERPMIAKTVWKKEMEFDGHSESGHHLVFDAGAAHANGPTPMEAVLIAPCARPSADGVALLGKERGALVSLTGSATAEQAAWPPR